METKAIAKTVRIAPRKVRLVIDLIRGKDVKEAQAILMFTPRGASPVVLKVLNSAIANAEHNNGANVEKLYVKEAYVNEGVRLKRMMPRAKGQGDLIQKRTSHITVVVAERE
ncbi:MAG TPA: 50S ribosomal protein L22 [Acholeplasma sp.]|jgi:large subunit ribosomal protein L22|nr:50S ribosomal protein L22 [Acholeplasma sp.]